MTRRFARASLAGALLLLAACQPSPTTPAGTGAEASHAADAAAPVAGDVPALRDAASRALAGQRIYAPAGDNAIELYLGLRRLEPQDATIATALLELLPYALIGSEQAIARSDFTEARRLLALIEQVDPSAAMLDRLRADIAGAEARDAARRVAEAEQARLREQQAAEAAVRAEQQRLAAAETPPATGAPVTAVAPPEPSAAAANPAPAPVAKKNESSAVAATIPAAAAPAPRATAAPRLLSAPPPRYPLAALRRKIEGEVTLAFRIQPDGSVAEPRVVASTPAGLFEEAAIAAANRWRFESTGSTVAGSRVVQFRLKATE